MTVDESADLAARPSSSLGAPPDPVREGERALAIPALVVLLVASVGAIAGLAALFTLDGGAVDYGDVMRDLPARTLLRQAWLPQAIVGLAALVLMLRLGWTRRSRLALPTSVGGWVIGGIPCIALAAALDYGYLAGKGDDVLPVVFLTFLTVGFTEELLFRGIGIGGFQQRFGLRRSWLFASGLFGLAHIVNIFQGQSVGQALGQVVVTTLIGLVFGLLAIRSGSLVLAMIAHGLWDILAVSRLMASETVGGLVAPSSTITTMVIGCAALGLIALRMRSTLGDERVRC